MLRDYRLRRVVVWLCVCIQHLSSAQTCISFGVDFQDGGSYFQNSLSNDDFTFVSEYEGCNNDTANNVLVAPNGDEYLCSNTPLQPPDTPEMSTCPIEKSQLYSGEWSILTISNNGNGDPIAYERDFSLSVGPQQTVTLTPTVTLSSTVTPVVSTTSTSTFVATSVLPPSTVTSPVTTLHPTTTTTPRLSIVTTYKTLGTLTLITNSLSVVQVVRTATASCTLPAKTKKQDAKATISPTVVTAAALQTPQSRRTKRFHDRELPNGRLQHLEQRKEHLRAINKRAPDQPTVTVTDLNTADYITTTVTSTAPATTLTTVDIVTTTTTSTPAPITVLKGTSTAPVVTVTAPTPLKTLTLFTAATKYLTVTLTATDLAPNQSLSVENPFYLSQFENLLTLLCLAALTRATVTTTITPSSVAAACTKAGGTI